MNSWLPTRKVGVLPLNYGPTVESPNRKRVYCSAIYCHYPRTYRGINPVNSRSGSHRTTFGVLPESERQESNLRVLRLQRSGSFPALRSERNTPEPAWSLGGRVESSPSPHRRSILADVGWMIGFIFHITPFTGVSSVAYPSHYDIIKLTSRFGHFLVHILYCSPHSSHS